MVSDVTLKMNVLNLLQPKMLWACFIIFWELKKKLLIRLWQSKKKVTYFTLCCIIPDPIIININLKNWLTRTSDPNSNIPPFPPSNSEINGQKDYRNDHHEHSCQIWSICSGSTKERCCVIHVLRWWRLPIMTRIKLDEL